MNTTRAQGSVAAAILVWVGAAWGQVYVEQGHVLDANNRLGSGGLNTGGRRYDLRAGNRFVTGNVTGGQSFRGFSPIRDPSSLFLSQPSNAALNSLSLIPTQGPFSSANALGAPSGLPSDRLSGFTRDSVGVQDIRAGYRIADPTRPFYSTSNTVMNAGSIAAGLNRPGTSQIRSPYGVPQAGFQPQPVDLLPSDYAAQSGTLLNVKTQFMRIDTGKPITGTVNPRLLGSPLFGSVRAVPVDTLAAQAQRDAWLGADVGLPVDRRMGTEPIDLRTTPAPPVNEIWVPARGLGESAGESARDEQRAGGLIVPLAQAQDVYAGLRAASGSLRRRLSPGVKVEGGPSPVEPAGPTLEERFAAAEEVAAEPLKTFVGTEDSVFNKYLARAEAELKAGQFYEAASLYDLARTLDLRNPLPLVGRSMALLAAGDYMTSVNNLLQAIQFFESLGHFRVDLPSFVPDLTVLDRRRADLERRLEMFDDFRLRFLLGFAEYCSGMEEQGLEDLEKAAQAAPKELTSAQRFVELLKRRTYGATPPPGPTPEK